MAEEIKKNPTSPQMEQNVDKDGKYTNFVWYLLPNFGGYFRLVKDELYQSGVLPAVRKGDVSRDIASEKLVKEEDNKFYDEIREVLYQAY